MPHDYQEKGWSTDLMDAINDQLRLGWDRILYGVWSASWETIQQQHFENIGSKKSATVWFSLLQQKLWMITFHLWEHRNTVLHTTLHSIHPSEIVAINDEITQEVQVGLAGLPTTQRYLFHGTSQSKLSWTVSMKIQWLNSIRSSRNHFYQQANLPLPERNETVNRVLHRWERQSNVKL